MPRLDLLISYNTGLSRRQVTRMFRAGRIGDPSGRRLDDPKVKLAPAELPRDITIDDEPHTLRHRFDLMQHKPPGVVTALRDARHPTAFDLLDGAPLRRHLRAIGRLDRDSTGLLLWTTDGELLHRVTHPRYAVPRVYQVALARPFAAPPPGFRLDDGHAPRIEDLGEIDRARAHPGLEIPDAAAVLATITLRTGRFHEVRRIFAALGSEVLGLCRVAYGPIELPADLPPGHYAAVDLKAAFHGLSPEARA